MFKAGARPFPCWLTIRIQFRYVHVFNGPICLTIRFKISRVVQQLQVRPYFLYLYLDALFDKDPQLASDFTDLQVGL
jgi:hypothetical protein